MIAILAIALGAALGAPARYLIESRMNARAADPRFPWAMLVINALGSLIAGIAAALTDGTLRIFLIVGICGSLTTFSGFGWSVSLIRRDRVVFIAALLLIPAACLAAFALGYFVLR